MNNVHFGDSLLVTKNAVEIQLFIILFPFQFSNHFLLQMHFLFKSNLVLEVVIHWTINYNDCHLQ